MSPPLQKKAKVDLDQLCSECWEHYRNFLDSLEEAEDQGDIDELQEIIEITSSHIKKSNIDYKDSETLEERATCWKDVVGLLPILMSVAYYHLADFAISEYLSADSQDEASALEIQRLLNNSLEYFPENVAAWSMGANFGRMSHRLSLVNIRNWYERAVLYSSKLRAYSLAVLEDDSIEDNLVKEWIELLLLNQVLGVEFEGIEEGEDEEEEEEEGEEEGQYSSSAVESTARFMCAMLWSREGNHDRALSHIEKFPLTHRLHPNVWSIPNTIIDKPASKAPLIFRPEQGLLPERLYQSMKKVFGPDAVYWKESNYASRGYYSYFMEYSKGKRPGNLIEEVIVNHLLPRAYQVLDDSEASSICGFEWWVHTRPIQANLGHNLHFDTDESMLAQEGKVTHPILSSVLYLSGGDDQQSAGTTIMFDQTPDSKAVANSAWLGIPKDNSFLLFPGNFLHGVLPCPGKSKSNKTSDSSIHKRPTQDWQKAPKKERAHRLTFMVGFWTRNVPKTMKERHMYGPCGPLPPATEDNTWVGQISDGYDDNNSLISKAATDIAAFALPEVSPAWQTIRQQNVITEKTNDSNILRIPPAIDHRFFVNDAPQCFRESLFEDQD